MTYAEVKRRGRRASPTQVRPLNPNANVETSLTRGQLNAVRAAFKGDHTRTHRPPVRLIPIRRAEGADNWRVEGRKHRLIRSIAIRWRTRMLRNPELYFIAALCVLANSSVVARPAKNTPVAPPPKQAPVRTDLTPRDKNECLAVAQTLNEQVKRLSQQTKRGIPREFTRVHRTLISHAVRRISKKAWISIDWMNGCLENFTKDVELGSCSKNGATLAHSVHDQTLVRRVVKLAKAWQPFRGTRGA